MDYRTDYIDGEPVTVMSDVWACTYYLCGYTTNIVEDRRSHRLAHETGIINERGLME